MSDEKNPYLNLADETPLEAAISYAEEGIPVFPCGAAGNPKAPRVSGGFKAATTDPAQIRAWWTQWPDAPIGVPTGAASGWTALDVDPRNGGDHTLDELKEKHGVDWTDTRTHITGSGGLHFIFRHNPATTRSATDILPGIDIKDEGGYIIVPPSQPAGFGRYTVKTEDRLAEQPQWMVELRAADSAKVQTAVAPKGDVTPDDITSQVIALTVAGYWNNGKRNRLNMAVAAYLYGAGWTKAAVTSTMDAVYKETQDEDTENRRDNVRRTISMMDEGRAVVGASALHSDFPELLHALDAHLGREKPPVPVKKHRLGLYSESDLESLPAPVPLIADVLDAGLTAVYGPPKTCKTFAVLSWAVAISAGVDWHGHAVEQGPVVYNLSEGVGKLRHRIMETKRDMGVVDRKLPLYVVPRSMQLMHGGDIVSDVPGLIANIRETLGEQQPRLIVVDTLARSMPGGDENHQEDMNAVVAGCTALMEEFGCSVVLVHHTGASGERMRGSSVLPGAVDMAWAVEKRGDSMVHMRTEFRKDGEEAEIALKIVPVTIRDKAGVPVQFRVPGGKSTREEKTVVLRALSPYDTVEDKRNATNENDAKIVRALLVGGWVAGNPATGKTIRQKAGVTRQTFDRRMEKLVAMGYIENKSGGRDGYYHLTEKGGRWIETLDKARESHTDAAAMEAAMEKE